MALAPRRRSGPECAAVDLVEFEHEPLCRHPWEQVRQWFFTRVLERNRVLGRELAVLDVGAGDGWFSQQLAPRLAAGSRVVCWDTAYTDAHLAGAPGDAVRFVRERPAGPFDLVLLLDVLEHVEDDRGFLAALVQDALVPGGHALVGVPAWQALFTSHDRRLRHHRRYQPGAARRLVRDAGLEVLASGGLFHAQLLPRTGQKLLEGLTGREHPPADLGHWSAPAALTSAIVTILRLDARVSLLGARMGIPLLPGLSWWALCRKPSR